MPVPGPPALGMIACCSRRMLPCSFAACTAFVADRILDCNFANAMSRGGRDSVSRLHKSQSNDLSRPFVHCPRACLVHQAGFVLYHRLGVIINCNLRHEQVCLCSQSSHLFRVGTLRRSAQRLADSRHDSLVQVDCRPVRCLLREAHLSNPDAQTAKARLELCSLRQLRDFTSKEYCERLPQAVEPSPPESQSRACGTSLHMSIHAFAKLTWSC